MKTLPSALPEGAETERPRGNLCDPQEVIASPAIAGEPRFDLFRITRSNNEQHIRRSFERPSEQDKALSVKGIHKGGMGLPVLLLLHRSRIIPACASGADNGEETFHILILPMAGATGAAVTIFCKIQ